MTIGLIYEPVLANYSNLEMVMESNFWPLFLSLLEVLFIFLMLLLEAFNIYLFQTKKIFHINIKLCLYYYYLVDFVMSAVRILFILFSALGKVTPLWIEVITSMRVFYLLATVSGMPVFLLERSFATYFSYDYQSKSRVYIPFVCTILLNLFTFLVNIYWLLTGRIYSIIIVSAILSSIGFTGYLFLVRYNSIRLRGMFNNRAQYTLGNRYQIDENLRTFRVLRNAFVIYSCHASLFLITVFLPFFVNSLLIKELFHFFMEIVLSTWFLKEKKNFFRMPAPIFICFILSYPSWKEELIKLICCRRIRYSRTIVVKMKGGNQEEQDVYFNQLFNSWS